MRCILSLLLTLIAFPLCRAVGTAQEVSVNGRIELTLTSEVHYEHPLRDVRTQCYLTGPSGVYRMEAFWDGDRGGKRIYKVRFAPPEEGRWTWRTVCSDTMNEGLHGQEGAFEVSSYQGNDPFRAKGWLEVSDDRRYLQHDDGEPFFLLGCTAWEVTWKSYRHEVEAWLSDRRRKEFNNIQLVVLSHLQIQEFGVRNRNGQESFINEDMTLLNPEYFRYLDTIVTMANDSGMVVTIVPLWADMSYLYYPGPHRFVYSHDDALLLARYVGGRYGAHNVIWIVGGDNIYETEEKREFWSEFGRELDTASGGRHLATVHTSGWQNSWTFFDASYEWLDYHTYHSSHWALLIYEWWAALDGYAQEPHKPVVNGEACYEDIPNNLDIANPRLTSYHVRHAAYTSILSGALVGFPYGANGIWQWYNGDWHWNHWPRLPVTDAMRFEGSGQMTIVRRLMQGYGWHLFRPRRDLVRYEEPERHLAIAANDDIVMAYFGRNMGSAMLRLSDVGFAAETFWINPSTGDSSNRDTLFLMTSPDVVVTPPDTADWLFVARAYTPPPLPPLLCPSGCLRLTLSPTGGTPHLRGTLLASGTLELSIWDIRGARIDRRAFEVDEGDLDLPLGTYPAGHYIFRATVRSANRTDLVAEGQAIVWGSE